MLKLVWRPSARHDLRSVIAYIAERNQAAPLLPRHCEERSDEAIQCGGGGSAGLLRSARNDGEWAEALAAFRSAEAEVRAFERATAGGSAEEEEVWLPVYEGRLDAFGGAVRGVMLAGAPDFAAFAAKLELFFAYEVEPHSVEEDVLAAIRGDARRLAGRQAQDEPGSSAGSSPSASGPSRTEFVTSVLSAEPQAGRPSPSLRP
jgi:hypothetical protein